jgi:hypothetical protein
VVTILFSRASHVRNSNGSSGIASLGAGRLGAVSEEEFLTWSEIRIVFPEHEDIGKVVLVAKANNGNATM